MWDQHHPVWFRDAKLDRSFPLAALQVLDGEPENGLPGMVINTEGSAGPGTGPLPGMQYNEAIDE